MVESHISDFSNLRIQIIVGSQLGLSPILQNLENSEFTISDTILFSEFLVTLGGVNRVARHNLPN